MAQHDRASLLLCACVTIAVAAGKTVPADKQALLEFRSQLESDGVST